MKNPFVNRNWHPINWFTKVPIENTCNWINVLDCCKLQIHHRFMLGSYSTCFVIHLLELICEICFVMLKSDFFLNFTVITARLHHILIGHCSLWHFFHINSFKMKTMWWLIPMTNSHKSMVSRQKGPTRHAYSWQIGPFWQDTLER